jgi:hypothetical protein
MNTLTKVITTILITFFFLFTSCVSVEKSHCDSSKKGNKKKMKKLRSTGGFNMGAVIKYNQDQSL